MLRAGLIRKVAAGIYTYLRLDCARSTENRTHRPRGNEPGRRTGESSCPVASPAELCGGNRPVGLLWQELLRFKDRMRDFCLGPTHEEVITDSSAAEVLPYRQMPLNFYQIRASSG